MMDGTEKVEAQLAAWIEGELDDAGRAEIEKHLAANPQHRKLLEELMESRQMLRSLPRAAAPADMLEALQQQLERSALLNEEAAREPRGLLRLRRWPQVTALAAILVLAVGLAAVVYVMVLPPLGSQVPSVAVMRPQPLATDAPIAIGEEADGPGAALAIRPPEHGKVAAEPDAVADATATREDAPRPHRMAKGGGSSAVVAAPASPDALAAGQDRLFAGEGLVNEKASADDTLILLVSTDDPNSTNRQLTDYLVSNSIAWSEVAEPMPQALNLSQSQVLLGKRLAASNIAIRDRQELQQQAMPSEMPGMKLEMPGTEPNQAQLMPQRQLKQAQHAAEASPAITADNVFVARGMRPSQAAELRDVLSRQRAGQHAEVIKESQVVGEAQTEAPLPPVQSPADSEPKLATPSEPQQQAEPEFKQHEPPQAAQQVQKDESGQRPLAKFRGAAKLPPVEAQVDLPEATVAPTPVPATQPQDLQLEQRIAQRYFQGWEGQSFPTTAPVDGAATQPAEQAAPPTSQPAQSEDADAPVDVVIIIQNQAPIPPATQPAP